MRQVIVISLAILMVCTFGGSADTACKLGFKDRYIKTCAPAGDGWRVVSGAMGSIVYGRTGEGSNETFIAQAGLARTKPFSTTADFLAFVSQLMEDTLPVEKYPRLAWELGLTDERSYPCVRVYGATEDKSTPKLSASGMPLILEVVAIYCEHPNEPKVTLFAIYSHRGETLYQSLKTEGNAFLASVQPPAKLGSKALTAFPSAPEGFDRPNEQALDLPQLDHDALSNAAFSHAHRH